MKGAWPGFGPEKGLGLHRARFGACILLNFVQVWAQLQASCNWYGGLNYLVSAHALYYFRLNSAEFHCYNMNLSEKIPIGPCILDFGEVLASNLTFCYSFPIYWLWEEAASLNKPDITCWPYHLTVKLFGLIGGSISYTYFVGSTIRDKVL